MAEYTRELVTEYQYPNLLLYRQFKDGVHCAYELEPADGYVMYNTAANNTELNPDTMEEEPVIYYYTYARFPTSKDISNLTWVAALRTDVDENYIFGIGGNNNHEVM